MDQGQADEQKKQAIITALRLLAASPKSGQELRKKLTDKGFDGVAVESALDELRGQGVLDDTVYARNLMTRLVQGKAAGRRRVAFELKRHGVSRKIRDGLLDSFSEDEEAARALEQGRLKWAGWSKLDPQKRRKRLYDFLIRKGYDFQIVQDVLRKLSRGLEDDGI